MTSTAPEQPPPSPRIAAILVLSQATPALEQRLVALRNVATPVVVDYGTGATSGLEERFPDARFIRLPRNFGLTKGLNLGIRAASAEMILFLSPDVEITPESVESLAAVLETDPAVGAVCPALRESSGQPAPQVGNLPTPAQPDPPLRPATPGETVRRATVDAILFRAFFLRALRNIDERYGEFGSSVELGQQVLRANKTTLVHPTATAILHRNPTPSTAAIEADREIGISVYLSKAFGWFSGFTYLLGRIFAALFSFRLPKFIALVTHKKIDGN